MSLGDNLKAQVKKIFSEQWSTRDGQQVPDSDDLKLSNDAVKLDGTVLYADLSGSTKLVDGYRDNSAAEIYKAYLHCAAKLITSEGSAITAYDGDRIMAVYIGKSKNTSAARSGLKWSQDQLRSKEHREPRTEGPVPQSHLCGQAGRRD